MPEPANLVKAELQEITWKDQQVVELDRIVEVQFNPETLKMSFSNQKSGGDQRGGASTQFLGQGVTKLNFDLWFDVTVPHKGNHNDVRRLTAEIAQFMTPKEGENGDAPPGVRVLWGTFLFEGIMESMNESLEFFSEDGRPLRASVSLGLTKQEILFRFGQQRPSNAPAEGVPATPGTKPLEQVRQDDTVHDVAARSGRPEDWPQIASANGIENPRQPAAGSFIDLRAQASVNVGGTNVARIDFSTDF